MYHLPFFLEYYSFMFHSFVGPKQNFGYMQTILRICSK